LIFRETLGVALRKTKDKEKRPNTQGGGGGDEQKKTKETSCLVSRHQSNSPWLRADLFWLGGEGA
jgi:hypothetical protein